MNIKICILESNSAGNAWYLIKSAQELNIEVIFLSEDKYRYEHLFRNPWGYCESIEINSAYNVNELVDLCVLHNVDFLIAPGDYQLEVASQVNEKLKKIGPSHRAIEICKNKGLMRDIIQSCENAVSHKIVNDLNDVYSWNVFPAIIKPLNGSGSVNVHRVDSTDEIISFYDLYFDSNKNPYGFTYKQGFLLEEFIEGDEFSAEIAWNDNHWNIIGVVRKLTISNVFDENNNSEILHIIGGEFEHYRQLNKSVNIWLNKIGLKHGYVHLEFIIKNGNIHLVEINPRLPGGRIVELFERALNISLPCCYIKSCLDFNYSLNSKTTTNIIAVCHIPIFQKGIVKGYKICNDTVFDSLEETRLPRIVNELNNDSRLISYISEADTITELVAEYKKSFESIILDVK